MLDIETTLNKLARAPAPPVLAEMDLRVLARVAGYKFGAARDSYAIRIALVALAFTIGVAGGLIPERSKQVIAPLADMEGLAPSSLLVER